MYDNSIRYLLKYATPCIAYRVRKELLGEPIDSADMLKLQDEIVKLPEIIRIFDLQKPDGWLGGAFHGVDEPEMCIRYLCEKGVEPSHPVIIRALEAIESRGDQYDDGSLVRVGKWLDDTGLGGSEMIKACVFACAGHEKKPFIQEQIAQSLCGFAYVSTVKRLDEIYVEHKRKLVFREGVKWPSIYHLRLLASTHCWKNDDNLRILSGAINQLVKLSPIPPIKLLYKNQIVSPAQIFMDDFNLDLHSIGAKEWMIWFHRTELIARLGIAEKVKAIKEQTVCLRELLNENDGLFLNKISHFYFTKWTQYLGLALEPDWKEKNARTCDLTFRSLLILNYLVKI